MVAQKRGKVKKKKSKTVSIGKKKTGKKKTNTSIKKKKKKTGKSARRPAKAVAKKKTKTKKVVSAKKIVRRSNTRIKPNTGIKQSKRPFLEGQARLDYYGEYWNKDLAKIYEELDKKRAEQKILDEQTAVVKRRQIALKGWRTRKQNTKEAKKKRKDREREEKKALKILREAQPTANEIIKKRAELKILTARMDKHYDELNFIKAAKILPDEWIEDLPTPTKSGMYYKRMMDAIDDGNERDVFDDIAEELDCDIHDVYEFAYGYGEFPG